MTVLLNLKSFKNKIFFYSFKKKKYTEFMFVSINNRPYEKYLVMYKYPLVSSRIIYGYIYLYEL